jgi:hypothetical protein
MKLSFKILLILLIPASLFAQDAAVVKKQATKVTNALLAGNYDAVIGSMYSKVVQMSGGKEKLLQMMTTGMSQMKAQGISFKSAAVGTPGKFFKAGTEIHCLVPETITMQMGKNTMTNKSNLLAISKDGGKNWSFLDLNRGTIASIPKIFPNFNKDLKIPGPAQPLMQ